MSSAEYNVSMAHRGSSSGFLRPTNRSATKGSYVIWRESKKSTGVGFFSIVASVLAQFDIAEKKGLVPVVDFETNFSTYLENETVNGTGNMWEYYFEQPTDRRLHEVEEGAEKSDGKFPRGYPLDLSADFHYREIWDKYIRLNPRTHSFVEDSISVSQISSTTLGVHFRGGDMRTARGHKFPPTQSQTNQAIKSVFDSSDVNTIFLVTEGARYERSFKKVWGSRLTSSPSFRLQYRNPYKLRRSPRPHHRYLLGLEVLTDAIALSRCGALVCGRSNLSEAALMLGRETFTDAIRISQGSNSRNPFLAPVLWYAKAALPPRLGGFKPWSR